MMKRSTVFLLGLIVLFTLFTIGCQADENNDELTEDRIVPVHTTTVEQNDLTIEKNFNGRLTPQQVTPVMLENPGEVDELLFDNDEQVEEDDIIAKIKTPVGIQNVRATKAGEITQLNAKEGDMLSGEDPIALIIQLDQLTLDFTVTEKDRSLFKKDDEFKVTIDEKTYDFVVKTVEKMPDDTGLYPVSGEVENKKDRLIPGMIATLHAPESRVKEALLVETEAIIEENEATFVYVIKDDQAIQTEVTVLESQSDVTAVEGDLNEDDIVVINGQLTLFDGAKVEVISKENET